MEQPSRYFQDKCHGIIKFNWDYKENPSVSFVFVVGIPSFGISATVHLSATVSFFLESTEADNNGYHFNKAKSFKNIIAESRMLFKQAYNLLGFFAGEKCILRDTSRDFRTVLVCQRANHKGIHFRLLIVNKLSSVFWSIMWQSIDLAPGERSNQTGRVNPRFGNMRPSC